MRHVSINQSARFLLFSIFFLLDVCSLRMSSYLSFRWRGEYACVISNVHTVLSVWAIDPVNPFLNPTVNPFSSIRLWYGVKRFLCVSHQFSDHNMNTAHNSEIYIGSQRRSKKVVNDLKITFVGFSMQADLEIVEVILKSIWDYKFEWIFRLWRSFRNQYTSECLKGNIKYLIRNP